MLRQLKLFCQNLLQETFLQVALMVDLIGLASIYISGLNVPLWIFYFVVPLIGLFIASFNIYRRGAADVKLNLAPGDEVDVDCSSSFSSFQWTFTVRVDAHISNYGPQSGIMEEAIVHLKSVNSVSDSFLLSKVILDWEASVLFQGSPPYLWHPHDSHHDVLELPFVVESGSVSPCSFVLRFVLGRYPSQQLSINETVDWIQSIGIVVGYTVSQSDGRRRERAKVQVPRNKVRRALVEYEERNPDSDPVE